ncbi:flavodoxin domain-containing protein [Salinivirga cyanobacteriivorans]
MKTLIVYATKHGTTEQIAKLIAEKAAHNTDMVNLKKEKKVDLHPYDQIIIGGSIHAGTIQKSLRKFIEGSMSQLLQKRIALFLSCMYKQKAQEQFDTVFPEILRTHAQSKQLTGGEFRFDKMNFLERAIVKKVAGIGQSISNINHDAIERLLEEMNLKTAKLNE